MKKFLFLFFIFSPFLSALEFSLPTKNDFLLKNKKHLFYAPTFRVLNEKKNRCWQGGQYGFSRNLKRISSKFIATKFHEGIDIEPLYSKKRKELDPIYPIAKGKVVYINNDPTKSNYGKYIVIKHQWQGMPFFSLYAHLGKITAKTGDQVSSKKNIGKIGYTGRGITPERAHLHLEFCLLLSDFNQKNLHGIYNGKNLIGLPAHLLFASKAPSLKKIWKTLTPYYYVIIPKTKKLPKIVQRYPFLLKKNKPNDSAWQIALSASGIPLSFSSVNQKCTQTKLKSVYPSSYNHIYRTRGNIQGRGFWGKLTEKGKKYIQKMSI